MYNLCIITVWHLTYAVSTDSIENRSVFQPFSSRGTFETLLSVWRNIDTQNSANLRILREPRLKTLVYRNKSKGIPLRMPVGTVGSWRRRWRGWWRPRPTPRQRPRCEGRDTPGPRRPRSPASTGKSKPVKLWRHLSVFWVLIRCMWNLRSVLNNKTIW